MVVFTAVAVKSPSARFCQGPSCRVERRVRLWTLTGVRSTLVLLQGEHGAELGHPTQPRLYSGELWKQHNSRERLDCSRERGRSRQSGRLSVEADADRASWSVGGFGHVRPVQ